MKKCPFKIGDIVKFTPSVRTLGLYQNIEKFGIKPNEVIEISEIKDGIYIYAKSGKGGWPWNEYTLVDRVNEDQD
jgi:hypothetical protein